MVFGQIKYKNLSKNEWLGIEPQLCGDERDRSTTVANVLFELRSILCMDYGHKVRL